MRVIFEEVIWHNTYADQRLLIDDRFGYCESRKVFKSTLIHYPFPVED